MARDGSGGIWRTTVPLRRRLTAERGRSVGISSTSGAPARLRRHQASWRPASSLSSQARCQRAKPAYCTVSSGRGDGRPAAKAA